MVLILLSLSIICPIYFIFTGKKFFGSKFENRMFDGETIDNVLEWLYNKLL